MFTWMLVTLDGTRRSGGVVPHAIHLAKNLGCGVTLVRVLPKGANTAPELKDTATAEQGRVPPELAKMQDPRKDMVPQAGGVPPELAKVEQYLKAVEARFTKAGIMTWTDIRYGDPAREIIKAALNCKADIVAMATRSRTGLSKLVFGSVAEQVLRDCDIPVLLITSG